MTTETIADPAPQTTPDASPETKALNAKIDGDEEANTDKPEGEPKPEGEKKERTPEERERIRLQRNNARLLQQRAALRARVAEMETKLTPRSGGAEDAPSQGENETLSLSRAELQELVEKEAKRLAPTLKQQQAEIEQRSAVVSKLAKEWGQEKFDTFASDLDDAFDGLADSHGRPKPATDAIFEADDPRAVIEHLTDPENAEEAEAIGRMSAVQAGRAIAKLEVKLAAKKAEGKPQPSKVPAPIEEIRGQGSANTKALADLSDADFEKRRRQQIAARR
jgi:hypothetical protein